MINRVLFVSMALLVVSAIGAGLYSVGGPKQARMEKEDRELLSDMRVLARHLRCSDQDEEVLPQSVAYDERVSYCGADRVIWRLTARQRPAVPIAYQRVSDTAFKVCAEFHDPTFAAMKDWKLHDFDRSSGCVLGTIR